MKSNKHKESKMPKNLLFKLNEFLNDITCLLNKIMAYSIKASATNKIHPIIQKEIAVSESVLGDLEVIFRNKFTKTSITVTRRPALPGTISGGMTKLICKL